MAPKKEDHLLGKSVIAPRSLWPSFPLPKGQYGFEGKVGKRKDAKHHFVSFPGDPNRYYFSDGEIEKWVVVGSSSVQSVAPTPMPKRKPEATPTSAAAAAAGSAGQPSKKAKAAAAEAAALKASPVKPPVKAPSQSPSQSPVKALKAAEPTPSKSRMRAAIDAALELLDFRGLEDVYKVVLDAEKKVV